MKRYLDDIVAADLRRKMVLIECKLADDTPHRALTGFAKKFPDTQAIQLVRDLRQEECRAPVRITGAADWLAGLDA